jgi:hypothetical protein
MFIAGTPPRWRANPAATNGRKRGRPQAPPGKSDGSRQKHGLMMGMFKFIYIYV